MPASSETCASEILRVAPLVMRTIRAEMRRACGADLSLPQYCTLVFLHNQPGASLSALIEHTGLTLSSLSALVDGLVKRGLLAREADVADRRRITLNLTARGTAALETARQATQGRLADKATELSQTEREAVIRAMQALGSLFARS